jgi:hypothetical protein
MEGGGETVVEKGLALTLFVAGVLANDTHYSFPAHDAAGFTELFDRWADFHGDSSGRK